MPNGVGDVLKKAAWVFLAASIAVAVFRGIPPNPAAWYGWAQEQVEDVKAWAEGVGDSVNTWVDEQPDVPGGILPEGTRPVSEMTESAKPNTKADTKADTKASKK